MKNKYNQEKYIKFLRFAALCVVLFLWGLSVWWSADGFSIRRPELNWVGIGLALSITVAQLVFNRGAINPTLFIVGLAAYVYGIGTNAAGIIEVLHVDLSTQAWTISIFATVVDVLIVVGLSLVVEIFPESLLLWVIYPELKSPGDFISTLAGGMNLENRTQKRPNSSTLNKINSVLGRNGTETNVLGQNRTKQYPYNVRWHMLDPNKNAYKVLIAHKEFWNKEGRDCPNKTLVQQTGVSKGQVSQIIKTLKGDGYV